MNQPKKIVNPYNKYIFSTKISLVVAIATFVIAVVAIIMTEYSLKNLDQLQTQLQQQTKSMQDTYSANQTVVKHLMHQSQQQDKQIDLLNQRITHQFEHSDRQWVEQAQRQLQLTQLLLTTQLNTTTSIQRLTTAQKALSQLPSSFYDDANTAIKNIIHQLKDSNTINVNNTIKMIQSLREMISKISFVPENENTFTAPTTQTNSSYWDMSKDVIKQLFTVHYHSTPVSPIKNSNQGHQLQQYLLLKTSELEWALLNNDYAFYQNNLKIIQQQLHSVVMNQQQQEAINQQIQLLQAITFGFPRAKIISQIETLLATLSSPPQSTKQPSTKQPPIDSKKAAPKPSTPKKIKSDNPLPSVEV